MRVIALLALLFGITMQPMLNGQPFTNAVFGVLCGVTALVCGRAAARRDPSNRGSGLVMAILGVALGVWCLVMLLFAYPVQKKFNENKEKRHRMRMKVDGQADFLKTDEVVTNQTESK